MFAFASAARAQDAPPASPEPAPVEPAPAEPAAIEPAPVEPGPVEPAQVVPAPATPAPADAPPPELIEEQPLPGKKKKKERKSATEKRAIATSDAGMFGVKGRVFTEVRFQRAERTIVDSQGMPRDTDVDSLDLVLDSARFSLLYQTPMKWLQAEVEIEIADFDQTELRDAYLLAESDGFHAKAGNFKVPTSLFELESAWDLPIASRGFINDLLEKWLSVAGRAPGVQLGYENRDGIEPEIVVGMFQGSVLIEQIADDRDSELIDEANMEAQSFAARAQVELGDFDVGVFFEHRVGSPAPLRTQHYPLVGADVSYDEMFGHFGLRAWLDGHYGESWYAHSNKPAGEGDPWFLAVRAIVAARLGGASDDELYGEVFTSLGMLDPDLDVTDDWARDYAVGFNSGLWDRARLTLEGYLNETSRNFPESYFGGPRGQVLGVTLQAGAAF